LIRRLRNILERLGAPGVLGLGVSLFCMLFYFTALKPSERELHAQNNAAERFKTRSPYQPVANDDRAAKVQRFQLLFPQMGQLADGLEQLQALARASKLDLQQAEYRLEAGGPALAAYRVTLPIRGDYPQIREFVGAVLKNMPTASVDALRFERKTTVDSQLEAQVRLTLHFRSQDESQLP
jgi:hypothetical protein